MKENWIISEVWLDTDDGIEYQKVQLSVYCREEDISDEVSDILGYAIESCIYEMEEDDYYRFPIPSWAICYLVNGDMDCLTDEELQMLRDFEKDFRVVDVAEESYFEPFPHFGLACDCYMSKCVKHS